MSRGRAVVIGLARSGTALARALHADGYSVVVVDRADTPEMRARVAQLPDGVQTQLGGYGDDIAAGAALIAPSPGVPWDAPVLQRARQLGVPVRSEMALFFERCRGRIIGITGTNGKTTTTSLVAAILRHAGWDVHLGGNIGTPLLDRLESVQTGDWVVLELSSFQLETVPEPRCSIACVLNVTPDHIDRHRSFDNYAAIKSKVIRFAGDVAVLGYDDTTTRSMAAITACPVRFFGFQLAEHDGATVVHDRVVSVEGGAQVDVMPLDAIPLFGRHNVLNVLAAVTMTRAAGVPARDIDAAVRAFNAVQHRLETVLDDAGVLWVNDSKATNSDSAIVALQAFTGRPIVWIGGGKGMGTPSDALADAVARHARQAILNGESAAELEAALQERGYAARTVVRTLAEAVDAARTIAHAGDVVLFSPGYKSFDQFRDFEHRGEVFTALVRNQVAAEMQA